MNNNKIAPIVMTAIVTLALATFGPAIAGGNPGAGCEADTNYYNGTMEGDIYFEQQGWMDTGTMTKTFNVPAGDRIKLAKVYTGFWQGSPGKGGHFNISVNGHLSDTYKACDPCPVAPCAAYQDYRCDALNASINWDGHNEYLDTAIMHDSIVGCGVHFVSYDATSDINAGAANVITVKTDGNAGCQAFYNIYLIALLVVYEDDDMPPITYWINEGALYLEENSGCDGPTDHRDASKWFNGTNVSNPMKVKLWSLGWPHVINTSTDGYTRINVGTNLGVPDSSESHGSNGYNEVMVRWNDISHGFLTPPYKHLLEYYDPNPLYERAFVEVLIVQGPDPNPDLIVTDIDLPPMMRPNKNYEIPVTVRNQGGIPAGPFNVSLVAGAYSYVINVPEGLAASTSTTKNFPNVILATGCYDFTAVADCYNNVVESYESNNASTVPHQVDNVIIVDDNSDFDDLVTESSSGWLPVDSVTQDVDDTYIIQGLTITNCVGSGISIKNTDVPFEIKDCTVHSCAADGMHFKNVINGKIIEDNEVRDCDRKGIKMVDCSYMEVDDNYLHDNGDYGVDVYMVHMPYVDSHHITITNNRIEDNRLYGIELYCCDCIVHDNVIDGPPVVGGAGYGIYVAGNDSCIHSNKIANCWNYGIKLDSDNPDLPTLGNVVFGNELVNNNLAFPGRTSQAYDSGTTNNWGSTKDLGYYYGGTAPSNAYDNIIGSYWDDPTYTCGAGSNGICTNPYNIDGAAMIDGSPTALAWTGYSRIVCGDANCLSGITMSDATQVDRHVNDPGFALASLWAADVNCWSGITMSDATKIDRHVNDPGFALACCKGCSST